MRRLALAATALGGFLGGCGLLIGVNETYDGPVAGAEGGTTGDGRAVMTVTPTDASSVPVSARPVPFPCDAGAWSLDCTFGALGSVALADEAAQPAFLAPTSGSHLYAAVPLDGSGDIATITVQTGGGDPRALSTFTGPALLDLQVYELVLADGETLAYLYAYLQPDAGPASLYGLLWDDKGDGGMPPDLVLPVPLAALPDATGTAVGIANIGTFFSDLLLVAFGGSDGPTLIDVGLSSDQAQQMFTVNKTPALSPFSGVTAVSTYAFESSPEFWVVGPTISDPGEPQVVDQLLFNDDTRVAYVGLDFASAALMALDHQSVLAVGPVEPGAEDGGATTAPFVLAKNLNVDAPGHPDVDAASASFITAASSGTLTLPGPLPTSGLQFVARTTGSGAPPASLLTAAAVVPGAAFGHDALVLARYAITPTAILDAGAAVVTSYGAQVNGSAIAALDPMFGVGGVVIVPLGYDGAQLGALRASAVDEGYFASLRLSLEDGTHPDVLVHVRGDGT